jgi:ATP/maltotriose-dependent transcriptional regulator MalT
VAHFQQGLAAKGIPLSGTESARDAEEAALLFGLGRAQAAILERDQLQEAICSLSRAFDYYANESDVGRAVAAADYLVTPVAGITRGNQLIGRALKLVPADSHQAGRLLSRYGRNLGIEENDYQGAQEALNKALTIARREKDATLEMWTLVNDTLVDYQHCYHQGCLEKSLRAIEGAHRLNEPLAELSGHFTAAVSLVKLGDPAGAQAHADVELALAEKLQYRSRLEAALVTQQTLAHLMGNWPVARAFIDRGLAATPTSGMTIGARVVLEYELGEFSQGEMYLERLLSDMRRVTPGPNWSYMLPAVVIPVAARITGDVNRFGASEAAAQSVLSSPLANPLRANTARTGLALIAVQRNDVAEAAKQYSALESLRGTIQYFSLISNDRLLGLLTQTMGNLGKVTEHFEAALAFCRRAGYRPELAWSLCDYADVLLQRNQPNGQIEARSLLEEAFTISGDLGMKPLMGRVRERLEGLESQSIPTPAYPHGLTQREAEVLRLIGQGKSNPQIAEELVISLNTVARHASNLFTKIGCSSRAEAAAYAVRHGLVQ